MFPPIPAMANGVFLLATAASVFLVSACAPPPAPADGETEEHAHGSLNWTEFSQNSLVFVDYAPPAEGSQARFLAHFTDLATGKPIASGEAELRLRAGGQEMDVLRASVSEQPGLFIWESFLPAGSYECEIRLKRDDASESFPRVSLLVHPSRAEAEAEEHALADAENPDAIGFSLEQQWTVELLTESIERRSLAKRVQVAGELEIPPSARAFVVAPFAGALQSANSEVESALPKLGQWVEANEVVARIEVPLSVGDFQAARATKIARSDSTRDIDLKLYELDLQLLEATKQKFLLTNDLEFATQREERVAALFERQLALAEDLEMAEKEVAQAEIALSNTEVLIRDLERAKGELEDRYRDLGAVLPDIETAYPMHAPIAGEVASMQVSLGQHLAEHSVVCEIINPDVLWLTAYVPEHDLAALDSLAAAQVRLSAYPDELFDLEADLGGVLSYQSRVLDPETRTATVRYSLQNTSGKLRSGMFADVLLASGAVEDAVAIPHSAIVQQDGLSVAFVMLDGEHFEKRVLRLGVRDGDWVEVRDGLAAGERVVTRGAYIVRLAASAPDSFGHGHVH